MAQGEIQVGPVRVLGVSDATVDYPWPLEELFPGVSVSAWADYRARFPDVFASATTYRSDYICYLLRAPGRNILVDTEMGPSSAPLAPSSAAAQTVPNYNVTQITFDTTDHRWPSILSGG